MAGRSDFEDHFRLTDRQIVVDIAYPGIARGEFDEFGGRAFQILDRTAAQANVEIAARRPGLLRGDDERFEAGTRTHRLAPRSHQLRGENIALVGRFQLDDQTAYRIARTFDAAARLLAHRGSELADAHRDKIRIAAVEFFDGVIQRALRLEQHFSRAIA